MCCVEEESNATLGQGRAAEPKARDSMGHRLGSSESTPEATAALITSKTGERYLYYAPYLCLPNITVYIYILPCSDFHNNVW